MAQDETVTRRDFLYIATAGSAAVGAVAVVVPFVDQMNPSADVLALASIEVDLSAIEVGQSIKIKWRGKPVFIRRRTADEIEAARSVPLVELPDPEDPDEIDRAEVDFDTGFSVLRIDWDRMQREKKRRGSGVRFQDSLSKGSAVLLVGYSGAIVERFVSTDKANPSKKSAASRVWRPAGKR